MTSFGPWIQLSKNLACRHDLIGERLVSVSKIGERFYVCPGFTKAFRDDYFPSIDDAMRAFDVWLAEVEP